MVEPKIKPNEQFFVKGAVQYSDVSQLVEGARLEALNENSEYKRNPYTGVTVIDPKIISLKKEKTETEQAVENKRFYASKHDDDLHFQGVRSKYPNAKRQYELPWIAVGDLSTKHVKQVTLHKGEEISRGRNVILCMRTFKGSGRPGMILDGVIVPLTAEEAKNNPRAAFESTQSRSISQELSELGLTLDNPTMATEPTDIPASKLDENDLPDGINTDNTETETVTKPAPAQDEKPAETKSDDSDPWADFTDNTETDSTSDDDADAWFKN